MKTAALLAFATVMVLATPIAVADFDRKSPEASVDTRSIDIVILWNTDAFPPPDAGKFAAFLGTLRKSDRIAVSMLDAKTTVALPMQSFSQGGGLSASYKMLEALKSGDAVRSLENGVAAVAEYLEFQKRKNAVNAIIIVGGGSGGDPDAGVKQISDKVLSSLLMKEIVIHALVTDDEISGVARTLAASTGGKTLEIPQSTDVTKSLALLYDSLQLRALELSKDKSSEVELEVDYRYLDEKVDTPDQAVAIDRVATTPKPVAPGPSSSLTNVLLVVIVILNLALMFLVFRNRGRTRGTHEPGQSEKSKRLNESPSFSRLTMDLNRFRQSFNDAEKRLDALGLDLEDYGIESWDMEKKLMDEYVAITGRLFLLLDHLKILSSSADTDDASVRLERKITRLLEDSRIEEMESEEGNLFNGKRHIHAGERYDPAPPGTILEVTRKGYLRADGMLHGESFILRPAEVIVSQRDENQDGDER